MGKSLMVLVFSFLTLSVVLTSCSSDDSSEEVTQVDLNNLGLELEYVPNVNDPNSYVQNGSSTPVTLLSLEDHSGFTFNIVSGDGVDLVTVIGGNKIVTDTSLDTEVGPKRVNYNVLKNGVVVGSRTLTFVVHYGQDEKVSVEVNFLSNDPNTQIPYSDVVSNDDGWVIKNVPWQYVVSDTNYKFQLVIVDGDNGDSLQTSPFSIGTIGGTGLRVCELSDNITNVLPNPKNISYKDYNNEPSKRLYKLKVRRTVVGTEYQYEFVDGIDNDCDASLDGTTNESFTFGCTTI